MTTESQEESADRDTTIVGIGASAGGLAALKDLLSRFKTDANIAFVVVVHLSPQHESHLAELLQPHCRFPVLQVQETTQIRPNTVYIIPPGCNLSAIDTHLRLSELEEKRYQRAPIDHFFRTLADTHDGRSIGVVLTGTGSDGTLGLRRIKEQRGLTLAQSPEEAEYDGMPRSAIAAGTVDHVLALHEIPDEILRIAGTKPEVRIPAEGENLEGDENRILQKIFAQVRGRTGHDFSLYKRSTILRRIGRRMQLHHIESLSAYLDLLRDQREEANELFHDLLITVTEFFRDAGVFDHLKSEVIPQLFRDKPGPDSRIRVWSVGCSTGEEAYSLAMLLLEESGRQDTHPQIQVFASDLHSEALSYARDGIYPEQVAAEVSEARLKRFFIKENGSYRIRREVRELVIFAPHNLLRDPPFSHLDLIVCRNVLIYLKRDVQQDVISLFHYALNNDGLLVLGTSETIDRSDQFQCISKEACLYRRRNSASREPRLPVFPLTPFAGGQTHFSEDRAEPLQNRGNFGSIHEQMVERYAPPSVLIDQSHSVLHASAHAGKFLQVPGGEPTNHIFRLVREPLRLELRAAIHSVQNTRQPFRSKPIRLRIEGEECRVVIRVQPSQDTELQDFLLIIFDELIADTVLPEQDESMEEAGRATVYELQEELELTRQRLQTIIEEYETSREEMQASNEELQSANEELRSTMEELETSKEELQSMNEELTTLNQENRHRVEELSQLSGDLTNLLSATDIATLFLDRELRIVRFTPRVGDLFNVRHTDRGRPLSDLTHHLGSADLQADAILVLERLVPLEREIEADGNRWYLTRTLPYRTIDDRIEGVVITFLDITERKLAVEALRQGDRKKDEFLAMLSHELRTPLAAILTAVQLLDRDKVEGTHRKIVDIVLRQVKHLSRLLDDLLEVSRITTGRIRLNCQRVDAREIAQAAVERSKSHCDHRSQSLSVSFPQSPLWIDADPARMEQAIGNLLDNASKYSEQGGRIELSLVRDRDELALTVSDNGIGIPPELIDQIFDLFRQGDRTIDRSQGGLGIGLSLVQSLVQMHGGRITAESAGDGQGSSFTVRLPLATAPESVEDLPLSDLSESRAAIRVLLVEDNVDAAQLWAAMLRKFGHQVDIRHTAHDALAFLEQNQPNVAVLDVGLPDMDGYELARRIRANPKTARMRLVALTGYGQEADRVKSAEAGLDLHLVKPVDVLALRRALYE